MIDFSPPTEKLPYDGGALWGHRVAENLRELLDMYRREAARAACMAQTYRRAVELIEERVPGAHPREIRTIASAIGVLTNQADGLAFYVGELVADAVQVAKIAGREIRGGRGEKLVAEAVQMGRDAARGRLAL